MNPPDNELLVTLNSLERGLDLAERLYARGRDDHARALLGRVIDVFGAELAKLDPVAATMLELDDMLAQLQLAALRERQLVELTR